jgi:hypothetical protein
MSKIAYATMLVVLLLLITTIFLMYGPNLPINKADAQGTSTNNSAKTNFETYTNSTFGIKIQYPTN